MKKLILISIMALMIAGCDDIRIEYSDTLHEKAVVVTLIYSPSQHNTELTNTMYNVDGKDGMIGTDWNGNTGIRVGKNLQITSTTIPEKYGVVFQCQHGTFTIEGSDQKYKILHDKLANSIRDTVDILYKEEFRVKYEDKNGQTVETSRTLNDMDFLDAQILSQK